MKQSLLFPAILAGFLAAPSAASADILLGTEFTGRTIAGTTVTITDYTLNGIADPGALTPALIPGSVINTLTVFTSLNSAGYLAVKSGRPAALNSAHWSMDIPMAVGAASLDLGIIEIDFQCFNTSGAFKPSDAVTNDHWATLQLLDGSLASLGSQQLQAPAGSRNTWTGAFNFGNGLTLNASETYTLRLTISNSDIAVPAADGNNVGIDAFRVNSLIVDTTPPDPNPPTFETAPVATGMTSITMAAAEVTDPSGVFYLFTNTTNSNSSGWQASRFWTDTGLTANTEYTYTVTARDGVLVPNANVTFASDPVSAFTDATDLYSPLPATMSFTEIRMVSDTSIRVTCVTATDENDVEYLFSNLTRGTNSGWQDSTEWTETGLTPDTSYSYTVIARDKSAEQNLNAPAFSVIGRTAPVLTGTEILATNFIGRTISGLETTITDYVLNGVTDPGPLTVAPATGTTVVPTSLYDTADSSSHIAVDTNGNSAHWQLDVPIPVGASPVTLGNININFNSFNASGEFKTTSQLATAHYATVQLYDGGAALVASEQIKAPTTNQQNWLGEFTFASGTQLLANTTYSLRIIISGASITSAAVAGSYVGIDAIRLLAFVPTDPFVAWQETNFPGETDTLIIGENADPDKDNVSNLIEYALNTDPNDSASAPVITPEVDGTALALHYTQVAAATDITYIIEWSTNLGIWSSVGIVETLDPDPAANVDFPIYKASIAKGSDTAKFLRLRVVRTPAE